MGQKQHNTKRRKWKHLSEHERYQIEILIKKPAHTEGNRQAAGAGPANDRTGNRPGERRAEGQRMAGTDAVLRGLRAAGAGRKSGKQGKAAEYRAWPQAGKMNNYPRRLF